MWGDKKPGLPLKPGASPEVPQPYQPTTTVASSFPAPVEVKTMSPVEPAGYPSTSGTDRATARLGPSLHFKGEITGNEDLHLDGSVEGLVHLEDRKLVVGASAKVTAQNAATSPPLASPHGSTRCAYQLRTASKPFEKPLIHTRHGIGYRMVEPDAVQA